MIDFHKIDSVDDPLFTEFFGLYTNAFPATERRSWAGLEWELNFEKRFCANALIKNDKFVGVFNYWTFHNFIYIEHFAIIQAFRSQNIGSKAMEAFINQTNQPIVIEVEMPNNPDAIRRIKFYEDLGFKVISHYYAQPPYQGIGFIMPMLVMSNDYHFINSHFDLVRETLYQDVYHFNFPSEKIK